jgi:flagellar basal body rod protein FlgG
MAFTQGLCQKLQTDLNNVAGMNAPALKRDRVGYLDALVSEENRMGFEAIPVPTNGKYRAVQVNYAEPTPT